MKYEWSKLLGRLTRLRVTRASHYTCRAPLFGRHHTHGEEFHLSYVVLGRSEIEIEGRQYSVGPADAVFIRPRAVHASIGDARRDYELIEIKFSMGGRAEEWHVPGFPAVTHVHNSAEFVPALDRVVGAYLLGGPEGGTLASVRMAEVLMLLGRETGPWRQTGHLMGPTDRKIRQAAEYIAVRYASPLTVEDLAELVGMSSSHFAAEFRRVMGVSPIELVIRTRLARAKELLTGSLLSVGQVAGVCGFASSQYFTRMFGGREGLSPGEFRRRNALRQ